MRGHYHHLLFSALAAAAVLTGSMDAQASEGGPVYLFPHTGKIVPLEKARKEAKATDVKTVHKAPGGEITWNITYQDGATTGFNDTIEGTDRKDTLLAVLDYIDSVMNFPGPRTLDVRVQASLFTGTGALASAGTLYSVVDGFENGDAYVRLVDNLDPFPSDPEVIMTVNFGYAWHSTTDPIPGAPVSYDLFSVLLHEVTHALGVGSYTAENGLSLENPTKLFTTWDNLLFETSSNTKVWDSNQIFQLAAGGLTQGDNTLDFRGAAAAAAFGSNPPIYSPSTFPNFEGSSISHWQQAAPIPANTVMRPGIPNNTMIREYHPFEIGMLQDLGYPAATPSRTADWRLY